jgi:4-amino-4-deoxy-L-arabinose transferase-like glycosyltransferase
VIGQSVTRWSWIDGLPLDWKTNPTLVESVQIASRIPFVLATLILVMVSATWVWKASSPLASVVVTGLLATDLAIMGHGHLVSLDLLVTLLIVAGLFALWQWCRLDSNLYVFLSSMLFGFALLTKSSSAVLIPVVLLLIVLYGRFRENGSWNSSLKQLSLFLLFFVPMTIFLINITYRLFGLWSWHRASGIFPTWLPLPQLYVTTLEWGRNQFWSAPQVWLNGESRKGGAWFYDFEAAALISTLTLSVFVLSLLLSVAQKQRRHFWITYAFAGLPALVWLVVTSLSDLDIGVRLLLPGVALMAVAGSIAIGYSTRPIKYATFVGVGAVALTLALYISFGRSSPIGKSPVMSSARLAWFLSDSNVDWGQDWWRAQDWVSRTDPSYLGVVGFSSIPVGTYLPNAIIVEDTKIEDFLHLNPNAVVIVSNTRNQFLPSLERFIVGRPESCMIGTSLFVASANPSCSISLNWRTSR